MIQVHTDYFWQEGLNILCSFIQLKFVSSAPAAVAISCLSQSYAVGISTGPRSHYSGCKILGLQLDLSSLLVQPDGFTNFSKAKNKPRLSSKTQFSGLQGGGLWADSFRLASAPDPMTPPWFSCTPDFRFWSSRVPASAIPIPFCFCNFRFL